jgi:hypothetical protein
MRNIPGLGLVVLRRLCGSLTQVALIQRYSPMRNWLLIHNHAAARRIEAGSVAHSRKISLAFGVSFRFGQGFGPPLTPPVDMLNAGIVDPAKVVRVALQGAASVAGLMITTEAMVAETPKKKEAPAMPGGGGMGGMDY